MLLLSGAMVVVIAGLPDLSAQDYSASQPISVPGVAYLAYQAPSSAAAPAPGAATPSPAAVPAPGTTTPPAANVNNLFSPSDQNAPLAMEAQSYAPNMIGDSIAPTFFRIFPSLFLVSPSGGPGRFKMADDTSPLPQDRFIADYSYCNGVNYGPNVAPVANVRLGANEFEPGFEKTFLNGAASVELRAPISAVDDIGSHFGNLGVALKALVYCQCNLDVCAGMSMNVPTGPNYSYSLTGLPPPGPFIVSPAPLTIENQSVHLLPFAGALWRPSCRLFVQGYIQVDVDVSGDQVINTSTSSSEGRVYDPTLLYVDLGAGYWLRKGDCSRLISGVALIGEIHVNESVGAAKTTVGGGTLPVSSFSLVDATAGMHLDLGQQSNVTVGYVAPLTGGPDRVFNGELRAFYNYRF
jgi:hypothetical protein